MRLKEEDFKDYELFGYCLKCKENKKLVERELTYTKTDRNLFKGKCENGHVICRFVGQQTLVELQNGVDMSTKKGKKRSKIRDVKNELKKMGIKPCEYKGKNKCELNKLFRELKEREEYEKGH